MARNSVAVPSASETRFAVRSAFVAKDIGDDVRRLARPCDRHGDRRDDRSEVARSDDAGTLDEHLRRIGVKPVPPPKEGRWRVDGERAEPEPRGPEPGLEGEALARRQGQRFIYASDLLGTLRCRELASVGAKLAADYGLPHHVVAEGENVAGVYSQRLNVASFRFAMIDDGLGLSLVPWSPSLEREIGRHVTGVFKPAGGVGWSFAQKRGIGL
jgi:hypothetical protein